MATMNQDTQNLDLFHRLQKRIQEAIEKEEKEISLFLADKIENASDKEKKDVKRIITQSLDVKTQNRLLKEVRAHKMKRLSECKKKSKKRGIETSSRCCIDEDATSRRTKRPRVQDV